MCPIRGGSREYVCALVCAHCWKRHGTGRLVQPVQVLARVPVGRVPHAHNDGVARLDRPGQRRCSSARRATSVYSHVLGSPCGVVLRRKRFPRRSNLVAAAPGTPTPLLSSVLIDVIAGSEGSALERGCGPIRVVMACKRLPRPRDQITPAIEPPRVSARTIRTDHKTHKKIPPSLSTPMCPRRTYVDHANSHHLPQQGTNPVVLVAPATPTQGGRTPRTRKMLGCARERRPPKSFH